MKTILFFLFFSLFVSLSFAQVQPGYYTTTAELSVAHTVTVKNGAIYVSAGGETSVYRGSGSKYVLAGYFRGGDEGNMRKPASNNPPYLVVQSGSSYKYVAGGQEKLYRLDAAKTEEFKVLFNPDKLEERDGDVKSEHVPIKLERVEELAPGWEKYMALSKSDPDNSPVWLQAAHAAIIASSYRQNPDMMNTLLKQKATIIKKMAPGKPNPCPDVIPNEIWDSVE